MSNEAKRGGFRPAPPTSLPTAPPPPPIGLVHQPACCPRAERVERILAALREPSEKVIENACLALFGAYWARNDPGDVVWRADTRQRFIRQLHAAIAAAEKEVDA